MQEKRDEIWRLREENRELRAKQAGLETDLPRLARECRALKSGYLLLRSEAGLQLELVGSSLKGVLEQLQVPFVSELEAMGRRHAVRPHSKHASWLRAT